MWRVERMDKGRDIAKRGAENTIILFKLICKIWRKTYIFIKIWKV